MVNKNFKFIFILAFIIKCGFSLLITNFFVALCYSLFVTVLYAVLFYKKSTLSSWMPCVFVDYVMGFLLCFNLYEFSLFSILVSLVYFVLSSGCVVYFEINNIAKNSSIKQLMNNSNKQIDEGIKALENENYQEAIELFNSAIKEHKKNYLGYIGMCNTLIKLDKKDARKFKYYKKKLIKYAPKSLKESIDKKY